MIRHSRNLILDVFDYNDHKMCSLYDNNSDTLGQAANVFISTQRNGWKQLTFDIPSYYQTENGNEPNYRIDYLKADYKIRAIDDDGVDWFIISQPKVTHKAYSKDMNVVAGHCSQLLKIKNLGLQFSDNEGNNVGTAPQLLDTILKGTGWSRGYVYTFLQKDKKTEKTRTLVASKKTGAFKLITKMCQLFEAKPVYHGDTKTVDILPINPFSKPQNGQLPDVAEADGVLQFAYSKNISNLTRKMNTANVVTKLYAYGSYGDTTHGYCGIEECEHTEHTFVLNEPLVAGQSYYFTVQDDSGIETSRSFTPDVDIEAGAKVIWSVLDPTSMMYVWVEGPQFADQYLNTWSDLNERMLDVVASNQSSSGRAYIVAQGANGAQLNASYEKEKIKNWFQYVTDYTYFNDSGLLSQEAMQKIASHQRVSAEQNKNVYNRALEMANTITDLASTIGSVDFCKLDVESVSYDNPQKNIVLHLNKTDEHPDGIIYRSDYDFNKKKHFQWTRTQQLKANGDPVTTGASMVFVVYAKDNENDPVRWMKAYVKQFDDTDKQWPDDDPTHIMLHAVYSNGGSVKLPDPTKDQIFLFGSNNINGWLGALEIADEAAVNAVNNKTKVVTVPHPVYFGTQFPPITKDIVYPGIIENDPIYYKIENYSWFWKYSYDGTPSQLYFCYMEQGDDKWYRVLFQLEEPAGQIELGSYWFDWSNSKLYRFTGTWTALSTQPQRKVSSMFGYVYKTCRSRDEYRQGVYQFYTYDVPSAGLPAGNYYIESDYDTYWVFTTKQDLEAGDSLTYSTQNGWITQKRRDVESPIEVKNYRFDNVDYHPANIFDGLMEVGGIKSQTDMTGSATPGSQIYALLYSRSQKFMRVYPNNTYKVSSFDNMRHLVVHQYDYNKHWLAQSVVVSNGQFRTVGGAYYIKLCIDLPIDYIGMLDGFRIENTLFNASVVINEQNYIRLPGIKRSGEKRGIISLIDKFSKCADDAYLNKTNSLSLAQRMIQQIDDSLKDTLGDTYRQGYWQKNDYVDGDEDKLYEDAIDNVKKIAMPQTTYTLTYTDLYSSDNDLSYGASDVTSSTKWPDLSIRSAIHLVDEQIGVNTWAYIDKIQKCYDQPWQTKITINTNMTTMAQHSFADVLSNIADVASQMKGKQSIIDRAGTIGVRGALAVDRLVGAIDTSKLAIFGGASTWYTDEMGNMVFESANRKAAMTLTGNGFAIANGKDQYGDWIWRTFGTGDGFTADEITTGYLSSEVIQADSITLGKLSSQITDAIESVSNIANGNTGIYYPFTNHLIGGVAINSNVGIRVDGTDNTFFQVNDERMGFFEITKVDGKETIISPMLYSNGNLTLSGNVTMASGYIGNPISGWTINDDNIHNGIDNFYQMNENGVYIGTDGINLGGKFTVDKQGNLEATSAKITGQVNATSLKIITQDGNKRPVENDAVEYFAGQLTDSLGNQFYKTQTGITVDEKGISIEVLEGDTSAKSLNIMGGKILIAKPRSTDDGLVDDELTYVADQAFRQYQSYISFEGNSVKIATSQDEQSFINFGEGKFYVDASGGLYAKNGNFRQLTVDDYPVLSKRDIPYEIFIGRNIPDRLRHVSGLLHIQTIQELPSVQSYQHYDYRNVMLSNVTISAYGLGNAYTGQLTFLQLTPNVSKFVEEEDAEYLYTYLFSFVMQNMHNTKLSQNTGDITVQFSNNSNFACDKSLNGNFCYTLTVPSCSLTQQRYTVYVEMYERVEQDDNGEKIYKTAFRSQNGTGWPNMVSTTVYGDANCNYNFTRKVKPTDMDYSKIGPYGYAQMMTNEMFASGSQNPKLYMRARFALATSSCILSQGRPVVFNRTYVIRDTSGIKSYKCDVYLRQ